MEETESDEPIAHLASPYSFNLHNVIWLTGAVVVTLALVALKIIGAIR